MAAAVAKDRVSRFKTCTRLGRDGLISYAYSESYHYQVSEAMIQKIREVVFPVVPTPSPRGSQFRSIAPHAHGLALSVAKHASPAGDFCLLSPMHCLWTCVQVLLTRFIFNSDFR